MAEDERFFGESDPEWAVSQLAAHVAASATPAERGPSWRVIAGVLFTTALVAGAFMVGLTHDAVVRDRSVRILTVPSVTLAPLDRPDLEPQATLLPAPQPTPTPAPEPEPEVVVADYVAPPAPAKPSKPKRPANQVGPNRPIKAPIDPDGR